jgi:hypothetical protein
MTFFFPKVIALSEFVALSSTTFQVLNPFNELRYNLLPKSACGQSILLSTLITTASLKMADSIELELLDLNERLESRQSL